MILTKLSLNDFRNYSARGFDFEAGINIVVGDNAVGKTNLLEAINLLSVGESFRAKIIDEMVRFEAEMGRVVGEIENDKKEMMELEVMVTRGMVGGKRVAKRKFLVEGIAKRKSDFVGLLPVVIFRPEDMELLDGSPGYRRRFLDYSLVKVDQAYERNSVTYEQALRRRNRLLMGMREGTVNRYALTFWDGLLIRHGNELQKKREDFVAFVNNLWSRSDLFNKLKLVYDKSTISESRLEQYKEEEVLVGYTLVGPHKDDFMVVADGKRELDLYGSRGEKRMAVLALKMGEIYFIESIKNEKPVLLLDDVFSELDNLHREEVLRLMQERQVVVTTADRDEVKRFSGAKVIDVMV